MRGAVATNDDALAETVRLMRNFGFVGFDNVAYPGTNGKMTEVCAAMGLTNLDQIATFIAVNRRNYHRYCDALEGVPGLNLLRYDEGEQNNFQYIVVEVGPASAATRDEIVDSLQSLNIVARRYFWPGCHRMQPYRTRFPSAGEFLPNTELVADRVVVLPTGAAVTESDIDFIAGQLRRLATAHL